MSEIDLNRLSAILFEALMKKEPLQALVSRVYDYIALPIIAFDVSFRLLAYAFPRPFKYDEWECIAAAGVLNEKIVDREESLSYQELMYSNGKSQVFNWGVTEEYPQVDGPILWNGGLLGYVGIGVERSQSVDVLLKANDLLAEVLAVYLKDRPSGGEKQGAGRCLNESFLVLDTVPPEESAVLKKVLPTRYLFAVLASDRPRVSTLQYVRGLICSANPFALGLLSKERYLYLLFYHVDQGSRLTEIEAGLTEVCQQHLLSGGISDFYTDISLTPAHRMQALLALAVGRGQLPERPVSSFRDSYLSIICCGAMERLGAAVCAQPGLAILAETDAHEGTAYFHTLEIYLECLQNAATAAEKLGIHKNTVRYRIRKIEELLGTDLRRDEHPKDLLLRIRLQRVAENLKRGGEP